MRTMNETLCEIRQREASLRIRRGKRKIVAFSLFSVALTAPLTISFASFGNLSDSVSKQTIYGTILLDEGIGGYVLAGVLAFMAGVIITVLCLKYTRKKQETKYNKSNSENHKEDTSK